MESHELQLVGVSFEDATPIPKVKTQARFRVPFADDTNFESLEDELEAKGSHLCDCISFRKLPHRFWMVRSAKH